MKHRVKIVFGLVGVGLISTALGGTPDSSNPYGTIAKRNAFSLRPAQLHRPPEPPPIPPPKITLLGIVSFGRKEVIFKTLAVTKPGAAPTETSFCAGIGERQGEIEVLAIDPIAGTARVKNHEVEQLLTLENDGLKPTGSSPKVAGVIPLIPPIPNAR